MANKNLELENVRLIFRNFSGKESRFNRAGDRNFCVIIDDPEIAQGLADDGWNVRILKPREEGDEPTHYLNVTVRYDNYPPTVFMVTRNNTVRLNEDTVGMLDDADIVSADLIINPSNWNVNGKEGIKAYLKTAYITIQEDRFADKYRRGSEIGDDEMPFT